MKAAKLLILMAAIGGLSLAPGATITSNTGGTLNGFARFGQSFTTPGGDTWTNIRFNFFIGSGAPNATGTLFLTTTEYLGSAAGLGSAVGLIGSTSTIVSSQWVFSGLVQLNPSTQYFAYADTPLQVAGTANVYAGGDTYYNPGSNYVKVDSQDSNFIVEGDVVNTSGVPEPGTMLGVAAGLAAMAGIRRRSK